MTTETMVGVLPLSTVLRLRAEGQTCAQVAKLACVSAGGIATACRKVGAVGTWGGPRFKPGRS